LTDKTFFRVLSLKLFYGQKQFVSSPKKMICLPTKKYLSAKGNIFQYKMDEMLLGGKKCQEGIWVSFGLFNSSVNSPNNKID
jgi:hypothetical protein